MGSSDIGIMTEDIPTAAVIEVQRQRGYGSVPGLDDEELADEHELERQVLIAEWGPIVALPWEPRQTAIRPTVDEFGQLDFGAFGTVDFDRLRPPFSKARYKADRLQVELRNALIMMSVVQERLSPQERFEVIEAIRGGVDDPDHFDGDKWFYANRYLHARRLRRQIRELREFAWHGHPSRRRW